jgi:hypothetical protein
VRSVAVAALLLGCAATLHAQHPQVRKGFWIGFGAGYGSAKPSCDGCGTMESRGSYTAHIRMGGVLSPHLLLGGDIDGWAKRESGTTLSLGNVTAALYYYPMPASGLFLKGGLGASGFHGEVSSTVTTTASGGGYGFTIGAGYDIRVGRNISLTPVANLMWGHVGEVTSGSSVIATGWKHTIFEFGLDLTIH